jgi:hypothetical protein
MLANIEAKQDNILSKHDMDWENLLNLFESSHLTSPTYEQSQASPPPKNLRRNMRASTMRKWLITPRIMLLYCHSTAETQKRHTWFLGAMLPGSKVFLVRWMGFSSGIFMSLNIRMQNVIPNDSEIVKACKRGDVLAARDILKCREACPNDITESNETLLMVCRANT